MKTIKMMMITTIKKITADNKTTLISDISENFCSQNIPVLQNYKCSKYW